MHPILFRIPLPTMTLQWGWVLLAAAAVLAIGAVWQFFANQRKPNPQTLIPAALAVGAVLARFVWREQLHATFEISAIPIYSYGVMLGLSLVVGWYLTLGLAEKEGLPKETMANNYVVTAIAAVIGSRVLYIVTNLDEFDSFASMFAMRRGGLVAYGGFLGGFLGSLFFLKRHRIPLLPWADVAVPSLASGLMITRIGCYLFGCDFGKPLTATAPLWIQKLGTFPHWADGTLEHGSGSPAWVQHVKQNLIPATADHSLPVHPTQIYESLVGALLLVFLLTMRRYQRFRGQIFLLFTFAYGFCRFCLEIFRDDAERGSIPPALQEHILLALSLAVLAVGYVIGFSQMVSNIKVRRVTQALAFAPAIVVYLVKRPETFAQAETYQLSTSQFVAITTGFAAAVAFNVFNKAALAHPESAMNLGLPPEPAPAGAAPADDEEDDEEDAEAIRAARRRLAAQEAAPKKKLKKKKKKAAAAVADSPADPDEEKASDEKDVDDDKKVDDKKVHDKKADDDKKKADDDKKKADDDKKKVDDKNADDEKKVDDKKVDDEPDDDED